ncbi:MAG: DNA replication and repair protein RecF, partial [Pseudomonadota bacterium]
KSCLSRGQTKLAVAVIVAAIAKLIGVTSEKPPILLIDDLASELDQSSKLAAIQLLTSIKTQAFFTAIEYNMLAGLQDLPQHLFHVEQGKISRS